MTTFVFRVRNVPAALYKALGGFATNGVNMTKLESYMVGGEFSATQFYADVDGHPEDRALAFALEELEFFRAKSGSRRLSRATVPRDVQRDAGIRGRVPDAVQRVTLLRRAGTYLPPLDGPRISSASRRKEAARCAASGERKCRAERLDQVRPQLPDLVTVLQRGLRHDELRAGIHQDSLSQEADRRELAPWSRQQPHQIAVSEWNWAQSFRARDRRRRAVSSSPPASTAPG